MENDVSGLPDTVQRLFDSGSEQQPGDSGSSGSESSSGVSESERSAGSGSTPQTREPGRQEYDSVVRQRDAIIREKNALANERRQLTSHITRLTEMWNQNAAPRPPEAPTKPEEKAPDPKIDPIGYLEFQRRQEVSALEAKIQGLQTTFDQTRQEDAVREHGNAIYNRVLSDEAEFRQRSPDYDHAMSHLDLVSRNFFIENGATEEQADLGVKLFKKDVFEKCIQLGLPVAEAFYNHALSFGWRVQHGSSPNQNIQAANRGREATSLSAAGRGSGAASSGGGIVTLEQFARMSMGDPIKMMISSDKSLFRKLTEEGEVRVA